MACSDVFKPAINDTQQAHYLTAIASLRAGQASQIFLLRRLGWMRETIGFLDEAGIHERQHVSRALDIRRCARADAPISG